jgi:predicted  nucleic acid-binding Zn-ribbon protein
MGVLFVLLQSMAAFGAPDAAVLLKKFDETASSQLAAVQHRQKIERKELESAQAHHLKKLKAEFRDLRKKFEAELKQGKSPGQELWPKSY